MIWFFLVVLVNRRLKDILTERNPGHKDSGNLQKEISLIVGHAIQFSHYGYCISSLCDKGFRLNNLVELVSLKAAIYYIYKSSSDLFEKLLDICIFFIISFAIGVYVSVFQNIIIEERNFCVFTIFRDNQLIFEHFKKTIYFRVLCPESFDPYSQLTKLFLSHYFVLIVSPQ